MTQRVAVAVVLAGAALTTPRAHAALDDVVTKNDADVAQRKIGSASLLVRTRGAVKEFADAHGKVFAASWTGLTSLPALFGSHYAAYEAALAEHRASGLHVVHVRTPELSVDIVSYGKLRRGKIVLADKLPKGVTLDALR